MKFRDDFFIGGIVLSWAYGLVGNTEVGGVKEDG